jgi:hypothetical protein
MKFNDLYNKLLNEIKYYGQDRKDQNDDRNAGLENDYVPRKSFTQKEGDTFTGKDGRKWVRVKKADGTLGVRPYKG